jgi:hypothetical protein
MAQELTVSVRYPPLFNAPSPRSINVVTLLPLSHNSMCHVVSRSSNCLEKKNSFGVSIYMSAVFCLSSAERKGRKILFKSGISIFCLDFLLRMLGARDLFVATVCMLFLFGDVVKRVWIWYYITYYRFGLATAPFSVVVWPDNGATMRLGFSRIVAWVWLFSRSGVNRRLCVDTLRIFFFSWVLVWTDQGAPEHRFVTYAYLKY